jgi:DNA-directed RNA polymerase specialized sigma24 family protein
MQPDEEVTLWLSGLARGDQAAVEEIWHRYFERLVRLARSRLAARHKRVADEEDVALSAFHSFCRGVAMGKFPDLEDRHDLWKLLVTITVRKAVQQVRRSSRQKRGGGAVRGESVFIDAGGCQGRSGLANVLGAEPTPEIAAATAEQCEYLLNLLPEDRLRQIAIGKLDGATVEELAEQMDCAPRTVERKLRKIRDLWARELACPE